MASQANRPLAFFKLSTVLYGQSAKDPQLEGLNELRQKNT